MRILDPFWFPLTLVSAIGSGLVAGLFFIFSNTILRSLARLPHASGILAMQSINATIQNPLFFLVFMGVAALCLPLAVRSLVRWGQPGSLWLLAGCALYLIGGIVVTMLFNVPRNIALDAVDPTSADAAAAWQRYVAEWAAWNHVRTVATLGAAIAFTLALTQLRRGAP